MTIQTVLDKWKRVDKRVAVMSVRISEDTEKLLQDIAIKHRLAKSSIASDFLLIGLMMYEDEQARSNPVLPMHK